MEEVEDIFDGLPEEGKVEDVLLNDNVSVLDKDDFFGEDLKTDKPEDSLINTILKSKGIDNGTISIVDDSGEEQEVNFYDLPKEEQLEIISPTESSDDENLDDSEIELLNHLRSNGLSVDQFLTQYRESILAEVQQTNEVTYNIDAYNDHELFLFDLKNTFDLTDEELQSELEKELANEELFTKKVTKLRAEYKQLEDEDRSAKQAAYEAERAEQYEQFTNNMVEIATAIEDFHGVYLEDNEKQETLSYLLDLDSLGTSQFSKDLNDPKKLYEAAWYLKYGKEAFQAMANAYEAEITRLKKIDKPKVVVQNSDRKINTIDELHY